MEMSIGTIFTIRRKVVTIILAIRTTVLPIIIGIRMMVDRTMPGQGENSNRFLQSI